MLAVGRWQRGRLDHVQVMFNYDERIKCIVQEGK